MKSFFKSIPFLICLGIAILVTVFFISRRYCPVSYEALNDSESAQILDNPYCGFYEMHGFVLSEDSSREEALEWGYQRAGSKLSLLLLQINLKNYSDTYLTQNALDQFDAILTAFTEKNKKVILRFLYDWDGLAMETEPSNLSQIKQHIEQASSVVNKHADCIFLLQGVSTGNNGEMHGTHYGDTNAITELMEYQASVIDPSIYLSVRTPTHLRSILKTKLPLSSERAYDGSLMARLGLYNDGMLGSVFDLGTYDDTPFSNPQDYEEKGTREEEIDFQNRICQYVPNGGEVVLDNEYNDLSNAIADLSQMHVSYLNSEHDTAVLEKWKNSVYEGEDVFRGVSGYDYIKAHLGYRYTITKSSLDFHPFFDDSATFYLTISNSGFSPAYRQFSSKLILESADNGKTTEIETDIDNRRIAGGDDAVFKIPLDVRELEKGTYQIYFSMKETESDISIQFANEATKDDFLVPVGTIQIP